MEAQRSSSVGSIKRLKKGLKKRKAPEEWKGAAFFEKKMQVSTTDKENHPNTELFKHKKSKKQQPAGNVRTPLSPRPANASRSTSAAVAMAKIASINAQAASRQTAVPALESMTGFVMEPKMVLSLGCKPVAEPVNAVLSPHLATSSPIPREAEQTSERLSTVDNIRRCSSAMLDAEASAELRLELSDRMALEAEKLHLESQIQAERASVAAKEMSLKSEVDDAHGQAEGLQATVQTLARQMKELNDSKQNQEKELRRQLRDASLVRSEMQELKHISDTLKREVDRLRQQVQVYKADNLQVEKELEHQKQINRRLSQRLSGHFSSASMDPDDDLAYLLQEASQGSCIKDAVMDHRDALLVSPVKAVPQNQLNPLTPKASSNAHQAPPSSSRSALSEGESDRRSSWIKVPTVTPSKAHAPAIYNEPKNKVKQQEYAQLLEQQIAERRQIRQQEHAFHTAPTGDYFPFGRPGSGAPVRDENSNVVANVTFSRSKRPVPVDHPAGPLFAQRSASQEMFVARKKHQ